MPRLWADWEILLTMAHSTGPFTAKWLTTEAQFYIFFWLLLCSNTWPRKGWRWQLPSNNRGRKGCRRDNWVWRKYYRKVVISFVDVCTFLDHLWWELVLGRATMWNPQLSQVFPMMPPWSTGEYPQKDKRLSWKMKRECERWRSVSFFSCECIPLSTPVKALSWHQLCQKLTCVTSF